MCPKMKSGTLVHVLDVQSYYRKFSGQPKKADPLALVAADNGAFRGWVDSIHLSPVIPVGTRLTLRRVAEIFSTATSTLKTAHGSVVGNNVDAVLVSQQVSALQVRLTSGAFVGKVGWVQASDVTPRGGKTSIDSFWETRYVSNSSAAINSAAKESVLEQQHIACVSRQISYLSQEELRTTAHTCVDAFNGHMKQMQYLPKEAQQIVQLIAASELYVASAANMNAGEETLAKLEMHDTMTIAKYLRDYGASATIREQGDQIFKSVSSSL